MGHSDIACQILWNFISDSLPKLDDLAKKFDSCHNNTSKNRIDNHVGDCPKVSGRFTDWFWLLIGSSIKIVVDLVLFSLESLFNTWFTLELVLRFISCDKKLAFVKNWLNIIDLIAILPYYLMLTASKAAIGKTSSIDESLTMLKFFGYKFILGASTNFGSTLKIFRLTRIVRVAKMRFIFIIFSFISYAAYDMLISYKPYVIWPMSYEPYDMVHMICSISQFIWSTAYGLFHMWNTICFVW